MTIRKQVKRFWKVFMSEEANLKKALLEHNEEEVKEIKKILDMYFEELCNCSLEIEEEEGIFELTFLPEQDKNAQLITSLLKAQCPKEVRNSWVIHASLPPLSKKALNTILKIKGQEYTADQFIVYYDIDTASHCLNVEMYCDAFAHLEPNKAMEIAVYMLMLYVGETALEAYINHIDIIDARKSGNSSLLSHFYEMLLDIIEEQQWSSYEEAVDIYRVYKLDELKVEDTVRKDMKMIVTKHPLLIGEVLNDEYFTYHQFFDYGGEYGYLYYEHSNREATDAYVRQQLEKKLNDLLYPLGIAHSIGGAIGTKYAYIDLAIFDKEAFLKALDKINKRLNTTLEYRSFE